MRLGRCANLVLVDEAELACASFENHGTVKHDEMALAHEHDQVLKVD